MSIRRASGFTLVELAVVMAVLSLLAALTTPNIMNEVNQIRARGAAEETQLIVDAARSYRMANGSWPGDATCSNALQTLQTTNPPMLVGIGSSNKYKSLYSTSCTAVSFSLDQNAVTDWDGYLANLLGGTQVVNSATNLIRTTIGIPGSEPALDSKLSRVATGNAELNRMRTMLLLGGNDINEVGTINAVNGNFSGSVSAGSVTATNVSAGSVSAGSVTATNVNAGNVSAGSVSATNVSGNTINANALGAQNLWVSQNSVVVGQSTFVGASSFNDDVVLNKTVVDGQVGCTTGAIARDASGQTLSCQSGVWKKGGSMDIARCGIGKSSSQDWSLGGTTSDNWIAAGSVVWHVNNLPAGQSIGAPVDSSKFQCMPYLWASNMYAICCPKS